MNNALHFVGFPNETDVRFHNAIAVFGQPDFVHRLWDTRAIAEIVSGDEIVFAYGDEHQPISTGTWDASGVPCSYCNCKLNECKARTYEC